MTDAERQARCRAARAAGVPVVHTRQTIDRRSRAQRWRDAAAELTVLQAQYAAWLEALPSGLQESATAEALQAICELELADFGPSSSPAGSAGTDTLRGALSKCRKLVRTKKSNLLAILPLTAASIQGPVIN